MNQNLLCLKFLFFTSVVSISSLSLLAQESKTIKTFAESSFLNQPKVRAHFGWRSKYVLEGREALGGASILSSSVEASYDHVFGGVWYGRSSSNDFRELSPRSRIEAGNRTFRVLPRLYPFTFSGRGNIRFGVGNGDFL